MSIDVVIKSVPAMRCATMTRYAPDFGYEALGPVHALLWPELLGELARLGVPLLGPSFATYADVSDVARAPEGSTIALTGAAPIGNATLSSGLLAVVDMPAIERVATTVYRGLPDGFDAVYTALAQWIDDAGEQIVGYSREVNVACDDSDKSTWLFELQFELAPRP